MALLPACPGDSLPDWAYRLSAHVVCHDQKYSFRVEVSAVLPHPPNADETERLLVPVAEAVLIRARGEGGVLEFHTVRIDVEPTSG